MVCFQDYGLILFKVDLPSRSSNIQAVERPVLVKSSRKEAEGFDLARALSNEQVSMSNAIVNPLSFEDCSIF